MADINSLVDQLSELTVLEAAELAKNALDQQALVAVARGRLDTFVTAITGQG